MSEPTLKSSACLVDAKPPSTWSDALNGMGADITMYKASGCDGLIAIAGGYQLMPCRFYLGIDVAKAKLDCLLLDTANAKKTRPNRLPIPLRGLPLVARLAGQTADFAG